MISKAATNFCELFLQHDSVVNLEHPTVNLASNYLDNPFFNELAEELQLNGAAVTLYDLNSDEDLLFSRLALHSNNQITFVFYDVIPNTFLYDDKFYRRLIPYLEADYGADLPKQIFTFLNISEFIRDIYLERLSSHQCRHRSLIQAFDSAEIISLMAFDTEVVIPTDTLSSWEKTLGLHGSFFPSEITSFSPDINGQFNFQGLILGVLPFTEKYGLITKTVELKIVKSNVIDIKTSDAALAQDLDSYFSRSSDNCTINEIGIGTNIGLRRLRPVNAFAQERYPGFHLGFGGSENRSIHMDFIFSDSQIKTDKGMVFSAGEFFL